MLKIDILARSSYIATAKNLSFLAGLGGKAARQYIVTTLFRGSKVHSHHVKLHAGTTLNKENLIIITKSHQFQNISLGLIVYCIIGRSTMADFQNGHTGVLEIQELSLSLLEHLLWQHGWTWVKVINTICFQNNNLLGF